MRMFVEYTGPQGAGTRCNFSRIAKVGARVGTGERSMPPVMEWARGAASELQKVKGVSVRACVAGKRHWASIGVFLCLLSSVACPSNIA